MTPEGKILLLVLFTVGAFAGAGFLLVASRMLYPWNSPLDAALMVGSGALLASSVNGFIYVLVS